VPKQRKPCQVARLIPAFLGLVLAASAAGCVSPRIEELRTETGPESDTDGCTKRADCPGARACDAAACDGSFGMDAGAESQEPGRDSGDEHLDATPGFDTSADSAAGPSDDGPSDSFADEPFDSGTDGGSETGDDSGDGTDVAVDAGSFPQTIKEKEGVDECTNDFGGRAETILVGQSVEGVIGNILPCHFSPAGPFGCDFDNYVLEGNVGDTVRVSLWGNIHPYLQIGQRNVYSPDHLSAIPKEWFLPGDRFNSIVVSDMRNATAMIPPFQPGVGGADYWYNLSTVRILPTATHIALPATDYALSVANNVVIFSFEASMGEGIWAETWAERLVPPVEVDTVLWLVDMTGSAPAIVGQSSRIGSPPGSRDQRLRGNVLNSGTHHLVADNITYDDFGAKFKLSISTYDPALELEPNDVSGDANDLHDPPVSIAGAISEGCDHDYFTFDADDGIAFVVEVKRSPDANPEFAPAVWQVGHADKTIAGNPNKPRNDTARLEIVARRNLSEIIKVGNAADAGKTSGCALGSDYRYNMTITPSSSTVTALQGFPITGTNTVPGSIDQGGKTVWYSFDVPGPSWKVVWIDLDLSNAGGPTGWDLQPFLRLYNDRSSYSALGEVPGLMLLDVTIEPGSYALAVSDADGSFSANAHSFRPRVAQVGEIVLLDDDGTHDSPANALPATFPAVPLPAVRISANLPEGVTSWYSLGVLQEGQRVTAFTDRETFFDVPFALYAADGVTAVAKSVQVSSPKMTSLIDGVSVPSTGPYFLAVTNDLSWTQDLRLFVFLGTCPTPADTIEAGDLTVNELFSMPVNPGGDANGDGMVGASDQFVEVVNFSHVGHDISGVVVRSAAGARYVGECGGWAGAGKAFVVFGGCAQAEGVSSCPGILRANTAPDSPLRADGLGLGLNDSGDLVLLVSREGIIVDKVAFGPATENVSFARGTGGVCDTSPPDSAVQPETACDKSICESSPCFTPGTKADVSPF